jgi:hypothetical protein
VTITGSVDAHTKKMYGQGYRFRGVVATFTATKRPAITPPLSGPEFRGRFRSTQKV